MDEILRAGRRPEASTDKLYRPVVNCLKKKLVIECDFAHYSFEVVVAIGSFVGDEEREVDFGGRPGEQVFADGFKLTLLQKFSLLIHKSLIITDLSGNERHNNSTINSL